jgi:hypothetical protein
MEVSMQSSKAFKAACLTVGLATAWSPVGTPVAKADSVQIHLSLNGTGGFTNFTHAWLGVKGSGAVHLESLGTLASSGDETRDVSFSGLSLPSDSAAYIVVGVAANNQDFGHHVVVSFNSPDNAIGDTFDHYFGTAEEDVYGYLTSPDTTGISSFLTSAFADPLDSESNPAVPTLLGWTAQLVGFSNGTGIGEITVDASIDGVAAVPLPSGVLMGGALLALVLSGKRGASWVRVRYASNLPCV